MIPMAGCLVLIFNYLIAFLSDRESLLPTIIRQNSWSSVGVFPLEIFPGGFRWFKIGPFHLHHRRVIDYDVNFFKSIKVVQAQIWDSGASNSRFDDGDMKLRTYCIDTSRLMFFSVVKISIYSLLKGSTNYGHGLPESSARHQSGSMLRSQRHNHSNRVVHCDLKIRHTPLTKKGEATTSSEGVHMRGCAVVEMFSGKTAWVFKEGSNFMSLLIYIGVGDEHLMIYEELLEQGRYFLSKCFVILLKTDEVSTSPKCPFDFLDWVSISSDSRVVFGDVLFGFKIKVRFGLMYSNETHRRSLVFYKIFMMLDIPSCIFWLQWKHSLWQQQCERRQQIFPNDHSEPLPESSSILISTRRQVPESYPTTLSILIWSLSSKLIVDKKCVKRGLNRLHLLPVRLPNDSRITSTSSSKLFQFPIFANNGCIGLFLYIVNLF